jgi:hypothetical protein
MKGEFAAWRSRGKNPEHLQRVNEGSWWNSRATPYFVVLPMAAAA